MLLALVACGSGDDLPTRDTVSEQTREFSADDKRVARLLSIGSTQKFSAKTSAYDRALSCSIALETVKARLSASGQMNPAIINTINQVSSVYDTRTQQLGAADGKSTAEIAAERLERTEEMADQGKDGQIAIGCLRAMT